MKKSDKSPAVLIVLHFLLISAASPCFSADLAGEIINVNLSQKVAFIDLGKDSVSNGDVFAVEVPGGSIYMEVADAAAAVSKLALCQNPDFKNTGSDFSSISVGAAAKRVLALKSALKQGGAPQAERPPDQTPSGIPEIDPQLMVKPNIANETIQSLDTRLDKMVESNVKLFNALTALLNEKKQWQADADAVRAKLQDALSQIEQMNLSNAGLKKQLADANFQSASATAESDRNRKLLQEAQAKLQALGGRLDHLNKIIQDRLKQ